MKKTVFWFVVLCVLAAAVWGVLRYYSGTASEDNLKEGDLIFHTSQSNQSPAIRYATGSALSHCGIIIEKKDGLYVLEATHKLKLTPLQEFINRGKGGRWWAKRVVDEPVKIRYNGLLGRPYDMAFKRDNNLYYCSELIYDIYKKQLGIELCPLRKVSSYNVLGVKKVLKRRGISLDQLVVAPSDIFYSDKVHDVKAVGASRSKPTN